ncbi:MAG: hypothetical protein OEW24_03745 [Chloroflexota bacterium]|nr:hypothetical protein [Chloroflexota bacterium]
MIAWNRAAGLSLALLLTSATSVTAVETVDIEAGLFVDYVAPDAGALTPGSITFGFYGTPEVIAADAVLVPPADTNLPFLASGAPVCLQVTRDLGEITAMTLIAECTVTGPVTLVPDAFGPGVGAYLTSDRVITPESLVFAFPGLETLMKTTADSGGTLSITFTSDPSTGIPISLVATTEIAGPVTMLPGGDVTVGSATLPDEVIDATARALLQQAADLGYSATVSIAGSSVIDLTGETAIVDIVLLVTPTDGGALPDTAQPQRTPLPFAASGWLLLLSLLASVSLVRTATRRSNMRDRAR